jgi:C4-dicarboxylate-specific signal transduction histidine kinase
MTELNKGYSILIAEDTAIQAKKLQYSLKKFGYNVTWKENGQEAYDELSNPDINYSLIISDYQMPILDGLGFLEKVKTDPILQDIPFIILTTIEDEAVLLRSLSLGANEFLNKPFKPEELELRSKNLIMLFDYKRVLETENVGLTEELIEKNKILEDKLGELKEAHVELQTLQGQLIHSSKMASLGTMGAGMAHEINNPLAIIKASHSKLVRLLESDEEMDGKVEKLDKRINGSITRIVKIVDHLRQFSGSSDLKGNKDDSFDLVKVTKDLRDFYGGLVSDRSIVVKENFPDSMIEMSRSKVLMEQTLLNLIHNAIDAMESSTDKNLSVSVASDGKVATVNIGDTGSGIPQDIQDRIFDPFFTTKGPSKGTGLGMSLVKRYVEELEGKITFVSDCSGTTFTLTFEL